MHAARFVLAAVPAFALALALALTAPAPPARAAAEPGWDGAKASLLAQRLVDATDDLYDAFYKQPKPPSTPRAARDYDRLQREIRRIRNQARGLAADLSNGAGREETRPAYESLLVTVGWARERARSVFTTQDVADRAASAGELLEQLADLYEPGGAARTSE